MIKSVYNIHRELLIMRYCICNDKTIIAKNTKKYNGIKITFYRSKDASSSQAAVHGDFWISKTSIFYEYFSALSFIALQL